MSSDLTTVRLEQLGPIVTGKTPPKSIDKAFDQCGTPFITPKDMDGRKWIDATERYLSDLGLDAVKKSIVPRCSVAVSCIGSDMGKAVLVDCDSVTNQQINTILVDSEKWNPEYIYYLLTTKQQLLKDIAGGSATPILNKGHFGKVEIDVPSKELQDQAAKVLSAFDEKIRLNTQLNQTLEQIAQAIFKSWFVDFEPVKAKIAVLEAGLPAPVRISDGPREGIFCTYVIECDDGSYYIGQTDNLKRRWREHLSGKGAQWTKTHKPLQIAHFEENSSREEAAAKEKNWKTTSGRRELKKLIASGAARQAGGTAEQAELAAMSVISAKDEAALKQLQAEQPGAYAELAQTAALFPSALVDSELGEIPEGWEYKKLKTLCRVINGRAYKNTEFKTSGTPIVRIQNLSDGGKTVYSDLNLPEDKLIDKEDFIYAWSATFGPYIWRGQKSIYHYHIWKMDVDEEKVSRYFLYLTMFRKTEAMKSAGTGSIFTHLTKKIMEEQDILVASDAINNVFATKIGSIFKNISLLTDENQNLKSIRDSLLPKLLAGHLPITNTEVA